MLRILVITASLPYPPASGGAIRTLGILHGLHNAGHQITLLSFDERGRDLKNTPLAEYCLTIHTVNPPQRSKIDRLKTLLMTNKADIETRFYSTEFEAKLRLLLANNVFDLVQFEAIESVTYMPIVKEVQPSVKICFDTFNAEYMLQRRIFEVDRAKLGRLPAAIYSYLQIGRITRFERKMCQLADCVIAVSQEDAEHLRVFRQDLHTYIMQSGVFVDDYAQVDDSLDLPPKSIVFTGKMDYRPNVDAMMWFTDEIFPLVQQELPDVQLFIVGQKPHPRLDHLRQQQNVHITGWVDSTQPYLHAADIYIAPLRMGSGTRLKLLEAMSSKRAIIATTLASAGLHDETKSSMVIKDSAFEFAQAIINLMDSPSKRQQMGEEALKQVRMRYDWSKLIAHLLNAYKEIGLG